MIDHQNWEARIERISCFQDLIEQEEKFVFQNESSLERITALQNAIKQEEQALLNQRKDEVILSLVTLKAINKLSEKITMLIPTHLFATTVLQPAIKNLGWLDDYYFDIQEIVVDQIPDGVNFAILPFKHPSKSYVGEVLLKTELNLYAAPEYLEKYGEPKILEDLSQHVLIRPQRSNIIRKFTELRYKPIYFKKDCLKTDSMASLIDMAKQGMGIICFSDKFIQLRQERLEKINKLEDTYEISYIFNVSEKSKNRLMAEQLKNALYSRLH